MPVALEAYVMYPIENKCHYRDRVINNLLLTITSYKNLKLSIHELALSQLCFLCA